MTDTWKVKRIIAGCDGTPSGRDALALAAVLGRPTGADILAVGVHPDPLGVPYPPGALLHDDAESVLRDDRHAVAPAARIRAIAGMSPAQALRHAVEREHAGLLVLGSARRTEGHRVHAGHHAHLLLHDSPCPVALAPHGFHMHPEELRQIVVGVDDGPEAAAALRVAQALAAVTAAHVRVVTALGARRPVPAGGFEVLADTPEQWEAVAGARRRHARELLAERLPAGGVEAEVVEDDPGPALVEASSGADLLVIGSRRWGPLARLVMGGTGEHVVHGAHCPVLVVPRAAA
ncbi:MAG TPA: universal stress protein [Baekduia sp.]|nr:universal stress protein [Baekduia sp.]